jgi:hypothetical protein
MGKNVLQTVLPLAAAVAAPYALGAMGAGGALGAGTGAAASGAGTAAGLGGAFGSADMLAAGAAGGLLPGAAGAAVPGSIESAGLLDMGGGNMVNPDYFIGESIGKPMFAGSPDLPFSERAGNVLSSLKDGMGNMKMPMQMMGQPQQTQQVSRPPAIQRPQAQPNTETQLPYSQGVQLSPEQREMLRQRMMMGGLLNGAA